jgi:hypothetical protein
MSSSRSSVPPSRITLLPRATGRTGFVSLSPEPPSLRIHKGPSECFQDDLFHRYHRRHRHRSGHPFQMATRIGKAAIAPPCGHSPQFGAGLDSGCFRWHRSHDCLSIRITGCQNLRRRAEECRIGHRAVRMRSSSPGLARKRLKLFGGVVVSAGVGAQHLRRHHASARSDINKGKTNRR